MMSKRKPPKTEDPAPGEKFCFVISPIGAEDSDDRRRANGVMEELIRPAAREAGLVRVERADHGDSPGLITDHIVKALRDADLVVADLTTLNPNVMYELAVRHVTMKPLVQIIEHGHRLPFDIKDYKTVHFTNDPAGMGPGRKELAKAMTAALTAKQVDNPISRVVRLDALERMSRDSSDVGLIAEIVGDLKDEITSLRAEVRSADRYPQFFSADLSPSGQSVATFGDGVSTGITLPDIRYSFDPLFTGAGGEKSGGYYCPQCDKIVDFPERPGGESEGFGRCPDCGSSLGYKVSAG